MHDIFVIASHQHRRSFVEPCQTNGAKVAALADIREGRVAAVALWVVLYGVRLGDHRYG